MFTGKSLKVAIGPLFNDYGGVNKHILGIEKYSSNKISVVPSKFTRSIIGMDEFRTRLYRAFMNKTYLNNYDVLHSHVDPWFTKLCLSSRKKNNCLWIHTYHTFYFEEDYANGLEEWMKAINNNMIEVASKADVKISISEWFQDYLYEKFSIETEILPNAFDSDACNRANPHRFSGKYGLSDYVLFVGSISSVKNPKRFVELAERMPDIRFVMIGNNLDIIHLMKEYRISIPGNLFLINRMKHEDVLDAISACKVFVMTSKHEGIPTVLLEAMGMGKPVVAPSHSGCKEVILNKNFGFLYEPGSIEDLVEKTRQALISKNIGNNARERVYKIYDWKVVAKQLDSIYESCK